MTQASNGCARCPNTDKPCTNTRHACKRCEGSNMVPGHMHAGIDWVRCPEGHDD